MKVSVFKDPSELGAAAAAEITERLNNAISSRGAAVLLLSTGASQFEMLNALVTQPVDWSRVWMYHLDEYIGLKDSHPASFVRYLKDRFISKVNLGGYLLIDGTQKPQAMLEKLNKVMSEKVVDVGAIGIGENAHIAFNDPPADFELDIPYHIVNLNDRCKMQQVEEGWFKTPDEVPKQAISMTCRQIMKCRYIASPVPHKTKASAIHDMLCATGLDPMVPATLLKQHPDFHLFLDKASASLVPSGVLSR